MKQKGMSIHKAASYVIARKGKGHQEKVSFMYKILADKKKKKTEKWQEISKLFNNLLIVPNLVQLKKIMKILEKMKGEYNL